MLLLAMTFLSVIAAIPVQAAIVYPPGAYIDFVIMYPVDWNGSYEDSVYIYGKGNSRNKDVTLNDEMIDYYRNKGYSNGWFVQVTIYTGGATRCRILKYDNVDTVLAIPNDAEKATINFHLSNIVNVPPPRWELQLYNGDAAWSPDIDTSLTGCVFGTENYMVKGGTYHGTINDKRFTRIVVPESSKVE